MPHLHPGVQGGSEACVADVVKMWVLSHGIQELLSYWLSVMVSAVSFSLRCRGGRVHICLNQYLLMLLDAGVWVAEVSFWYHSSVLVSPVFEAGSLTGLEHIVQARLPGQ